jgi:hypothetical protein
MMLGKIAEIINVFVGVMYQVWSAAKMLIELNKL